MRYQVPQFIEVEDKIFGPLTFKQFVYLAGGGGLCLVFFTFLPLYIMLPLCVPVIVLSLALAFYQVNGRPFITAIEHAFNYYTGSKLYLWKQGEKKVTSQAAATPSAPTLAVPALSQSKLKDLAWSLNIKDRATMGVVDTQRTGFEI